MATIAPNDLAQVVPNAPPAGAPVRLSERSPTGEPETTRADILCQVLATGSAGQLREEHARRLIDEAAEYRRRVEHLEAELGRANDAAHKWHVAAVRASEKIRGLRKSLYLAEIAVLLGGLLVGLGGTFFNTNPWAFGPVIFIGIALACSSWLIKRKEIMLDTHGEVE